MLYLAFTKKAKFSKQSVSHNINRLESLHFQNWRASTTKATGFSKYLMVFKTDYWITLKLSYTLATQSTNFQPYVTFSSKEKLRLFLSSLTALLGKNAIYDLLPQFTEESYLLISSAGFISIPAASLSTTTKSRKHASQNSILSHIGDLCLCNPSNR